MPERIVIMVDRTYGKREKGWSQGWVRSTDERMYWCYLKSGLKEGQLLTLEKSKRAWKIISGVK